MPPTFLDLKHEYTVKEDAEIGSRLFQLRAIDGDAFALVQHSINYRVDENAYFVIDRETGWVSLKAELDRETLNSITVMVTVSFNVLIYSHFLFRQANKTKARKCPLEKV